MRFAVVAVRTRGVELVRHLLARAVQVVFVRDGVDVDARRHVVFVEDDVVRERLVVDEFNRFTSLDRDGRRVETELAVITAELDGRRERRGEGIGK